MVREASPETRDQLKGPEFYTPTTPVPPRLGGVLVAPETPTSRLLPVTPGPVTAGRDVGQVLQSLVPEPQAPVVSAPPLVCTPLRGHKGLRPGLPEGAAVGKPRGLTCVTLVSVEPGTRAVPVVSGAVPRAQPYVPAAEALEAPVVRVEGAATGGLQVQAEVRRVFTVKVLLRRPCAQVLPLPSSVPM